MKINLNFDDLFSIEKILIKFIPSEIVLYISKFYLYPHQYLEKYRVLYNYILSEELPIIRAPFKDIKESNFKYLIYYKLKSNYTYYNFNYKFLYQVYNKEIHVSPYVRFYYYLSRFQKYIQVEEVTNCNIDDYKEYVKNTSDFRKVKNFYKLHPPTFKMKQAA
jgi:hypothetical protein